MGGAALAFVLLALGQSGPSEPCLPSELTRGELLGPVQEVRVKKSDGTEVRLRYDREGFLVLSLTASPTRPTRGAEGTPPISYIYQGFRVEKTGLFRWILWPLPVPPEYDTFGQWAKQHAAQLRGPLLGGVLPGQPLPPGSRVVEQASPSQEPEEAPRTEVEWEPSLRRATVRRYDIVGLVDTRETFFDATCRPVFSRTLRPDGSLRVADWHFFDATGCLRRRVSWEPWRTAWEGAWEVETLLYDGRGLPVMRFFGAGSHTSPFETFETDQLAFDRYGNWTHRRLRTWQWVGCPGPAPCEREVVETRTITYYPESAPP